MKTLNSILIVVIAVIFTNCGAQHEDKPNIGDTISELADNGSSEKNNSLSSSAAVVNKKDTLRKFVRTADIKFKVKDVVKSTYQIENSINRFGGFVTYTNMFSTIENVRNTLVCKDSIQKTTTYIVNNSITFRVPNTQLDTTLKEIALTVDFLDARIIKAEDVALQMLSNKLLQKRALKNEQRLTKAIDTKGKKLKETTLVEDVVLGKQEQADDAYIKNLELNDKVNYSTVTLILYQSESIKKEILFYDAGTKPYEPNFWNKLIESLQIGLSIFQSIFLFLFKLWPLFIIGVAIYFIIKKFARYFK